MLVLTRRCGELLAIGHEIKIVVQQVRGNQVRLAIDAPKEIRIVRQELLAKQPN